MEDYFAKVGLGRLNTNERALLLGAAAIFILSPLALLLFTGLGNEEILLCSFVPLALLAWVFKRLRPELMPKGPQCQKRKAASATMMPNPRGLR